MNEANNQTAFGSMEGQESVTDKTPPSTGNAPNAASVAGQRAKRKYTKRKLRVDPGDEKQESPPKVDPVIVEESVKTIVSALNGVVVRRCFDAVFYVTEDKAYSEQVATQASCQKEELKTIGKLAGQVAEQYGILGQHAPLAMLAGVMLGWTTRVWLVTREINALRMVAMEKGILSKDGRKPKDVTPDAKQ